ncbi:MAG: hypothetical protein ABIB97_05015 [Patescibacteria group bacterium]
MRDKVFKTINLVCLIGLVLSTIPSAAIDSWLGSFGLVKNEVQAGIIEPLIETDWHPFTDNAVRKKNEDGTWTANFFENKRYIDYQGRWQLKKDLLTVKVGDNAEIIFNWGDREFQLVPYTYFHGEKYRYENLNSLVKEQIDLQAEIKDIEGGKKWSHTLNKAKYLDKVGFVFEPAGLIVKKNDTLLALDDFLYLSFNDLLQSGYDIELTDQELVVANLKEGLNILDPNFNSTAAADGQLTRSFPSGTNDAAYPSADPTNIGDDLEFLPFGETSQYFRGYFSFDTSSIPDGDLSSISGASLYTYVEAFVRSSRYTPPLGWAYDYMCDTDDIGASLDTGDWDLSSPVNCVAANNWGGPGNEGWKSPSIGGGNVNKTGDTDIEIKQYYGTTAGKRAYAQVTMTEDGGANIPYLTVTYTEYDPVQKNWRWYDDEWDSRAERIYIVDDYDAQAYASCDTDGTFAGSESEFTSGDYGNIDEDDANLVLDGNSVENEYTYHRFVFTIDGSISDIYQVDVTWKGYAEDDDINYGHSLWIEENSTWTERDSGTSSSKETLSYSYTSGFGDIISGGTMEVAAQADVTSGGFNTLRSYYAEVKVYYNTLNEDLGAENAEAYKNPIFWDQTLKLRVTLENEGAIAGDNIRKALQYSTDESSWTDVSENDAGTPNLWRYGDPIKCGGTDDAVLPALLLTDSDTLATHNESGDDASTYDHAVADLAEYEFCLENYAATPDTLYYFRVYDNGLGEEVPLDTSETHPQLTTSEVPVRSGPDGVFTHYTINQIYDNDQLAMKFLAPDDLADWKIAFWGSEFGTVTDSLKVDVCQATEDDVFDANCLVLDTASIDPSAIKDWQADMAYTYDIVEGNYYWLHFYEDGTAGDSTNNFRVRSVSSRIKKEIAQFTTDGWTGTTEMGSTTIRIKDGSATDKRIYPMYVGSDQELYTADTYQIYSPRADLTVNYVYLKLAGRDNTGGDISLSICNHDTSCPADLATGSATFSNTQGYAGWYPIKLDEAITLDSDINYRINFTVDTASDWDIGYHITDPSTESLEGTSSYGVFDGTTYTDRDWSFRLANHGLNADAELENLNSTWYNTENVQSGAFFGRWAFKISPTVNSTLSSVSLYAYKVGSPTDNLEVAIQADSSGSPAGTDLELKTVAGSSLTTSATWTDWTGFSYSLTAGTDYWLVITRTGGASTVNYYRFISTIHYNDLFPFKIFSGGSWSGNNTATSIASKVTTSQETFKNEFYNTSQAVNGTDEWRSQSMAPEVAKKVKGFLVPVGGYNSNNDATATMSLYSDSTGSPGSELSGTKSEIRRQYQDDSLTETGLLVWEFADTYTMSADTRYWIVHKALDGTASNESYWLEDTWRTESDSWKGTTEGAKHTTSAGSSWSDRAFDFDLWAIVDPYGPKSVDWRFYGDEASTTPSSPYAAENTAPDGTIGDGDVFKLRLTLDEETGTGIANSKKRIQYDTASDFSGTPTYVGESGSATIWRYSTSCGGADNGALAGTVISGTPTAGTYNESGTSTTTYDHEASTLTEFEFCIENNSATAATPYYFRAYDVATDEAIDKASGETFPSLTTATYSLQILAEDKNIGFTDYGLPGSGTSTHVFTSDEEIIASDWTGSGIGWSVTASATDLDNGEETIDNSNIDWTTGTIWALYGADTTSVTTACAPCNLNSEQTIFSAASGYGKGSYYIQPTVVLTLSESEFIGNYVSEVTLTIS